MSLSMQQFIDGIEVVLQSNPGLQANKESLNAWYHIVSDMPHDLFASAVFDICRNLPKTPYGVNLGALIREKACALALGSFLSAEEAWGEVLDQVRRSGIYGNPSFSNNTIALAVKNIGWKNICLSDVSDGTIRAHFYRTYSTICSSSTNKAMSVVGDETAASNCLKKLILNGLPGHSRPITRKASVS